MGPDPFQGESEETGMTDFEGSACLIASRTGFEGLLSYEIG